MTEPKFELVVSGLGFPEGPVARPDGSLLFVDIEKQTLCRLFQDGSQWTVDDLAKLPGGPNGLAIGPDGAAYVCNNGGAYAFQPLKSWPKGPITIPMPGGPNYTKGRIQRVDLKTRYVTTLYDSCDGKPLLSPDDIVFDGEEGFWFTDAGLQSPEALYKGGVYYARTDGSWITKVAEIATANGIGLLPAQGQDPKKLYVSDTLFGRLWEFVVTGPGKVADGVLPGMKGRVVQTLPGYNWVDSLKVLQDGRICVGTLLPPSGITVFGQGGETKLVPLGDALADPLITNLCFGGDAMTDVWVTASGSGRSTRAGGRTVRGCSSISRTGKACDGPSSGSGDGDMEFADERTDAQREMAETILEALRHPEARDDTRRVHACGVGAKGFFTASPVAASYCRAAHFALFKQSGGGHPQDAPRDGTRSARPEVRHTRVTIRFSNGSGSAIRHDGWSDVRGMAVRFHLDDGTETDLIAMTLRCLFAPTPETFLAFSKAGRAVECKREPWWRKLMDLLRLMLPMPDPYPGESYRGDEGAFDFAKQKGNEFCHTALSLAATIGAPASYLRAAYHAVHTFVVTGSDGTRRHVRFEWQPIEGVLNRPADAPIEDNYLEEALADRLSKKPAARFSLMMMIGETGDAFDDCSRPWPPHRTRVEMGTLTLTDVPNSDKERDEIESMRFNPWRLTHGIEPSNDPLLQTRRDAYDIGSEWRLAARAGGAQPGQACPFSGG